MPRFFLSDSFTFRTWPLDVAMKGAVARALADRLHVESASYYADNAGGAPCHIALDTSAAPSPHLVAEAGRMLLPFGCGPLLIVPLHGGKSSFAAMLLLEGLGAVQGNEALMARALLAGLQLHRAVTEAVAELLNRPERLWPLAATVTRREREALAWAAEGKTTEDIATIMAISVETARAHLDSVRMKLSALNRAHTIANAFRCGLLK